MDEKKTWKKNLEKAKQCELYHFLTQRRFHKTPGYGRFERAISGITAMIEVGKVIQKRHIFTDTGLALGVTIQVGGA